MNCKILCTVAALLAAPAAHGAPVYAADDALGLVVGAKAGAGIGLGPLGVTGLGELELGYTLPLPEPVGRDLQLFVGLQYAQPTTEGEADAVDARLPEPGTMRYEITQRQFVITPGLLYRIPVPTDALRPYVALGARAWLWENTVDGQAGGQAFGTQTETGTHWGVYGALGVDWFVGPGAALFEVQGAWADLDGFVMRDTHLSTVNVALGYRLML